jgi:AraC family transcriptional regulator of adaptative response/methylated-DNA-[protein]-cysteine methyltransferase
LLGKPAAARAVGSAVAKNPLAYLIPCHRVIRETGVLGDYRWGRVRKRAIMAWESSELLSTQTSDAIAIGNTQMPARKG